MRFPNQKMLKIGEKKKCGKDNWYCILNKEALLTALKLLNGNEIKVFLYFISNMENYTFALSSADICDKLNISRSTFTRAIKKFLEIGYLVKDEKGDYIFYDYPHLQSNLSNAEEEDEGYIF